MSELQAPSEMERPADESVPPALEYKEQGKALREKVPRNGHKVLNLSDTRPNPITLLQHKIKSASKSFCLSSMGVCLSLLSHFFEAQPP